MIRTVSLLLSAALFGYTGVALAQTALGPNMTTVTGAATATMAALPANPSRKGVTICNEHATNTVTFTGGAGGVAVTALVAVTAAANSSVLVQPRVQ